MSHLVAAAAGGGLPIGLIGLCALACPVIMGVMMWRMNRGGKSSRQRPSAPMADPAGEAELAGLRAEIDQLKAAEAGPGERPVRKHR